MFSDMGEIVKTHRKAMKLTQKQLADLAGVGKAAVWDLENSAKSTRVDTLEKILQALNIRVEFVSPLKHPGEGL
jgi:transcriptional regulator with XRE-family HTH domain